MKTSLFLISSLIISISLVGCSDKTDKPTITASNENITEIKNTQNYDDFTKLMENFKNNIVISGFSLIPPMKTIFLIERDFTFNKKDTITLKGGVSDLNTTQQQFIFENNDKSIQLYVRFAYTEVNMGNNLVAWDSTSGYDGADRELLDRTDMATYTYKNLIVTVTQNAKTTAKTATTKEAVKSVLNVLEKYYSK
ncbi:hypothetical protein [Paenibacillus tyrfis]|uniref:hypothetical protein n=1 Tax=Paenibacillus tyrfis TaxID=1501230 RepID=UPI00209CA910|nr:hypothetical protein [Paenibacillus tyrfis]MCP1310228.1 hypothetical protein [Paenibacillus tyrfis]GLI07616.1 hypothetical protein YDYSG_36460 [Paenibacillus tyrfis]